MLFDTHVHFDEVLLGADIRSILDHACDVRRMIAVGGSPGANRQTVKLAAEYPDRIQAAVGYGRHRAEENDSAGELRSMLKSRGVVAIGETGLDLYHDKQIKTAQIGLFQKMLEMAREFRLPVIVHSRDAEDLTIDILSEHVKLRHGGPGEPGVLHCFTGSREFAGRLLDLGFFISFSGILTFRNANDLREVAALVPADRILIETDSPYLAPEPHRGIPNMPAFVRRVAETLAAVRNCSFEEIACITSNNAERLFHEKTKGDGR